MVLLLPVLRDFVATEGVTLLADAVNAARTLSDVLGWWVTVSIKDEDGTILVRRGAPTPRWAYTRVCAFLDGKEVS